MRFDRCVAGNIQCKAGFAHPRPCPEENKVRSVQTGDGVVQFLDARGNAAVKIRIRGIQLIQTVKLIDNDFIHTLETLHIFSPPDIENTLFSGIQQSRSIRFSCRRFFNNIPRRGNQRADIVFIPDDCSIILHVGNRRNQLSKLKQIGFCVRSVGISAQFQALQNGDKINRFAFREHPEHDGINPAVAAEIKIIGPGKDLRDAVHAGRIQKDGAEDGLLRLKAERKVQPAVTGCYGIIQITFPLFPLFSFPNQHIQFCRYTRIQLHFTLVSAICLDILFQHDFPLIDIHMKTALKFIRNLLRRNGTK